ncbi:MAG: hypothetical protein Sapg2KO_47370 [Saprospiraceae bacterium]
MCKLEQNQFNMLFYKVSFLLFFSVIFCFPLTAQHPYYEKTYPENQLKADLKAYQKTLETVHAGFYWYTPKAKMDSLFEATMLEINQPMTERDFYNKVAAITAAINCGHTGTIASPKSRKTLNKKFPLEFQYLENQVFLSKDYTQGTQPYKVVKSINKVAINRIINQIAALRGTDGFIKSPKPLIVNNSENFSYWYHLIYPDSSYEIELADGQILQRTAISPEALTKFKQEKKSSYEFLRDSILITDNTAVLTINSFDKEELKSGPISYKKHLTQFFKTVKQQGIENLIIDLRENGGGEDNYASLLYRYLTDQTFIYYESMECKPVPYQGLSGQVYLPSEVKNGLLRNIFIKQKQGRYFVKPTFRTKGLRKQNPKKDHFSGNLYFLISGKSYSASAEIVAYAQAYRPNTYFIGQEAGGAIAGNTSALSAYTVFEHTRIAAYIPLVRYTMNIKNPEFGRGVQPDYPIIPSVNAYQNGIDEALEKALELIRNER